MIPEEIIEAVSCRWRERLEAERYGDLMDSNEVLIDLNQVVLIITGILRSWNRSATPVVANHSVWNACDLCLFEVFQNGQSTAMACRSRIVTFVIPLGITVFTAKSWAFCAMRWKPRQSKTRLKFHVLHGTDYRNCCSSFRMDVSWMSPRLMERSCPPPFFRPKVGELITTYNALELNYPRLYAWIRL